MIFPAPGAIFFNPNAETMKMNRKKRKILLFSSAGLGLAGLLAGGTACSLSRQFGTLPDSAEQARFETLDNYADGRFRNREPVMIRMKKGSMITGLFRFLFTSENAPDFPLPQVELSPASFTEKPAPFAFYWLGHSSLIFELDGVRFMTDPVFGNAAPLPGIVRRYCEAPLKREDLPPLDFIIISHDHYDHLEYKTICSLRDSSVQFIVPLGVGARLNGWGIARERIHELNWNDSITFAGLKITALPSRHFSGRSGSDRDKTLWAAFLIEGGGKKIFFGADGGYGAHFREIGQKYGPFDLVCLEIDAWNEHWRNNHMFPEEVVSACRDLGGAGFFLPIHWGVFDLAMHPWDESIRKVCSFAEAASVPVLTPLMGEKVVPGTPLRDPLWWRKR